ncbi:MAG: ABC transporter ATP-binding protein [Pirellulales bacterium]
MESSAAARPNPSSPSAAAPVLDVHDVTVAYHQRPVLWDVDYTLHEPSLVGIIGPNGAGKSTFIKAILGLVPLAGGSVQIFGGDADQQRRRIGYVPQRESVDWDFPVSVLDVVLMGTYGKLGWFRRPKAVDVAWAKECLHQVGMADFARRQIGQLSGGQQQRTFLARALRRRPTSISWTNRWRASTPPRNASCLDCSSNCGPKANRSWSCIMTCVR